jgi:hypothetical protein
MLQVVVERTTQGEGTLRVKLEEHINRVITADTSLVGPHQEISIREISIGLIMSRHRRLLLVLTGTPTLILVPPQAPSLVVLVPSRRALALKAKVNHKQLKTGRRLVRKRDEKRI